MYKNKKLIKSLLIILIILPAMIVSGLLIPDVQKYIIKNHLSPWISNAKVAYIHITPFSIHIKQFNFKYEAIDINIDQLESEFSPFNLLNQRIKIDKFLLNQLTINDASIAQEDGNQATLLFPGLFPYLNSRFIVDIGLLDIKTDYQSSNTGLIKITLSAQQFNEDSNNPLKLTVHANELPDIPDVQKLSLNSSIHIQQHSELPIDAKKSSINIKLTNQQGIEQDISLKLAMKQLPKPDRWDSFPFDKHRNHYLQETLHPESIALNVKHVSQDKLLSEIQFDGQYNGNEGIISGKTTIQTDKNFLHAFETLKLPKIESNLTATIEYNTRLLEGYINLIDHFKIENYAPLISSQMLETEQSSLPEKLQISNKLTASIDDNKLVINHLLLNIVNEGQKYIKLLTHKPILIDLSNLPEFLEQENSDLMSININQLPLTWFNDFIPEHTINSGTINTNIHLAIENKTLKLTSNNPVNLKDITLVKNLEDLSVAQIQDQPLNTLENDNKEDLTNHSGDKIKTLLSKQSLEADFKITINKDNLNAHISKLNLTQKNKNLINKQVSTSLTLNLKKP
ncbi:MAG: DUF748 domain-containing protein [gamma proteobacterium symbiont of Bathyaustriella thionipta]|nr:DUF748 domain-containing protein [gamma proteobacterium symbiont of Bathyaustriella thionipta]MCU7950561.1 DUF748 domain-containing protein [gamma proteobacterium symbiont of Bathyaustriella thionipta]MCU7954736.1 DUF748 domain-containing protein [gamma proteobacterium symbiont of Bathyaustriella thionipta]MCU7957075.1 DUF748 domain-containing protein [gamma proteobacterium symbiont of Bathyaustriella thionipta]MCU7967960.1 DUF748 domain-containing protein [gamma proteobacterium symbiont of 